jgi:hypothetical protein
VTVGTACELSSVSYREEKLAPLLTALHDLVAWFHDAHVQGMVIGGVAPSLLRRPRVTRDIDALLVLDEGEWATFLTKEVAHRFLPRISEALVFAQQARVLLVRHQTSRIDFDIALGLFPFEREAVAHAITRKLGRGTPPTREDLIVMKALAHRSRDLVDIESILAAQPKLDYDACDA